MSFILDYIYLRITPGEVAGTVSIQFSKQSGFWGLCSTCWKVIYGYYLPNIFFPQENNWTQWYVFQKWRPINL